MSNKNEPPLSEREIQALVEGMIVAGDAAAMPDFLWLVQSKNVALLVREIIAKSTANAHHIIPNVLYLGYKLGRLAAKKEATQDFVELQTR